MKQDPRTIINTDEDHTFNKPVPKAVPRTLDDKFSFQWKPDKLDTRDYKYTLTPKASPNIVDLRAFCSPIENQGSLGSCTGQAIAGAIELLNKRNRKPTDVSRLFIYYYERLLLGTVNYDSGAYIRDGIKVTNHYGASLESLWPHDVRKFRQEPITEAKIINWMNQAPEEFCNDEMLRNFKRNEMLIDLTKIPENLKTAILDTYETAKGKTRQEFMNYMIANRLKNLIEVIDEF